MRAAFGLGLVLVSGIARTAEVSASDVFATASRSVVVVRTFDKAGQALALGSGVVVARELIATNCHVLEGASSLRVEDFQKRELPAILQDGNAARDVCILRSSGLSAPPAAIGSSQRARIGEHVYAIGSPQGLELTLSDGLLSSRRKLPDGEILQTTAPISHGSSGGGLFNERAEVIGITTLYLRDSQQLNFAVPVEWVLEFLPKIAGSAKANAAADVSGEDQEPAAADTPFIARAARDELVGKITTGQEANEWNEIENPRGIFLPADTIHASVPSDSGSAIEMTARWTFGKEKELVYKESRTIASGRQRTVFSIFKPDGWPVGTYQIEIFVHGKSFGTSGLCVQDLHTRCRQVEGMVYSYVKGNIRHYSSRPPPLGTKNHRAIKYTFYELSDAR